MKTHVFKGTFAGHDIRYRLMYPETRYQFEPRLIPVVSDGYDVAALPEQIEAMRARLPKDARNTYVEYRLLLELTACALLKYDCCIFHAASFIWHGKAFLLTAPQGTGKTTQYLNWQRLFPGEITMISGDMPVLERCNDGTVWAHPSAWNGKEGLKGSISASVGGIVLLLQGNENRLKPLHTKEAVRAYIEQFMVRPETEKEIQALARIIDQMLRNIPSFSFENTGDGESTVMLRTAFIEL